MSAAAAQVECPRNKIVLQEGKVQKLSVWCLWNLEPWETETVERREGGFWWHISDPEHGPHDVGESRNVDDIVPGLHPKVRGPIIELFAGTFPDPAVLVEKYDDRHYEVVVLD